MQRQVGAAWWHAASGTVIVAFWFPPARVNPGAFGNRANVDGVASAKIASYSRFAHSMIVVLDVDSKRVLAMRLIEGMVLGQVGGSDMMAVLSPLGSDGEVVEMFHVVVSRP
jgi:hypothetical protein